MALKYMAGAMPSTPYTALNYLTGTPHITDYIKARGGVNTIFFSFHICDRAAEDKTSRKKPDKNPTVHS